MSSKNQYGSKTTEELGRILRQNRSDEAVLHALYDELCNRYSYDARELRQKVQRCLEGLGRRDPMPEAGNGREESPAAIPRSPIRNEFGVADEADLKLVHVLERMRERLLDLTNGNRLLNYRHPKTKSLRIVDEVPAQVFSRLLTQGSMTFVPLNTPDQADIPGLDTESPTNALPLQPPSSREKRARQEVEPIADATRMGIDPSYDLPAVAKSGKSEHEDTKLQTLLRSHELEKLLRTLHRDSISAIQESGANMLHLMFGFVEWTDTASTDSSQPKRLAPLVLLPVGLSRGDLDPRLRTYRYTTQPTGEDWSTNVTLQVKCRKEFGFEIPSMDPDGDENLEAYFTKVEEVLRDMEGWSLRRYLTLGLVSFGKILAWRDLDPTTWPAQRRLLGNSLFREILGGSDDEEDPTPGDPIVTEYPIDRLPPEEGVHLPLITDADSSQHSVLVDVRRGKHLVVQGPPGTGKSQTITNLIGDALSRGLKVLFVAEKKAALDVVAKRLGEAGLGPFCLALHSHTSQKREFLDDLVARLNLRGSTRAPAEAVTVQRLSDELREELNANVEHLHKPFGAIQYTPFQIFWRASRLAASPGIQVTRLKDLRVERPRNVTRADLARGRTALDRYSAEYQRVLSEASDISAHPWTGIGKETLTFQGVEDVIGAAAAWRKAIVRLLDEVNACAQTTGSGIGTSPQNLQDLVRGIRAVPEPKPVVPAHLPDSIEAASDLPQVHAAIAAVMKAREAWETVSGRWGERGAITLSDADRFDQILARSERMFSAALTPAAADLLKAHVAEIIETCTRAESLAARIESSLGVELPRTAHMAYRVIRAAESVGVVDDAALQLRSTALASPGARERLQGLADRARELASEARQVDGRFDPALRPEIPELRDHVTALATAPRVLPWLVSGKYRAAAAAYRAMTGGERVPRNVMTAGLRGLLAHRMAIESFVGDPALGELFGVHARGLESPFDKALAVLEWKNHVEEVCRGHGDAARAIAMALWSGSVEALREAEAAVLTGGKNTDAARSLASLLEQLEARYFDGTTLSSDQPLSEIREILAASELLLANVAQVGRSADDPGASVEALRSRLTSLRIAWQADEALAQYNALFRVLGIAACGPDTDIEPVMAALEYLTGLRAANLPKRIRRWLAGPDPASRVRQLQGHGSRIHDALTAEAACRNVFSVRARLHEPSWLALGRPNEGEQRLDALSLSQSRERLDRALERPECLHTWVAYLRERTQAASLGLDGFCVRVESGAIPPAILADLYEAALFRALVDEVFRERPDLNAKSGERLAITRRRFAEFDERWISEMRMQLAHDLSQAHSHPGRSYGPVADLTDEALIRHEAGKIRRHISIREMFRRAGASILALKPCFLMGPQAVAQYLAPGGFEFDLIVMDEASQMRPEDALGAIARGKQLVVVGDPKQLGPSRFFDRVQDDDEELEDAAGVLRWGGEEEREEAEPTAPQGASVLERSESILHAVASRYPTRVLRWHYRSKHPKLIAFSNREFYDEKLIIFPGHGGNDERDGVFFRLVGDGLYEPRAKRNVPEARAVVDAVRRHARELPDRSLLVATLNSTQAELIDALLEESEKEDAALAAFRRQHADTLEPLVVKNLENVQGDERDAIMVSVTFGRNADGQLRQNFGPINQRGGERRLNVLFTRAKHRLDLFCSFDPSDLRVGSDSPRGLQVFRDYLRHAQGADWAVGRESGRGPDSDFEIAVATALEARGYEVRCQVGVAGYFIDLGVVHPDHPGRFVLGVECDGAQYHSAKSARDRDRLRELVLTREFRWTLHRIWSTDWFRNPVAETDRVVKAIERQIGMERNHREHEGHLPGAGTADDPLPS